MQHRHYPSILFAVACAASLITPASAQTDPAKPTSIEDQLKSSSAGVGRFRWGYYGGAGWGVGSKISDAATGGTRPSGLALDGGVYGLFNPIRDFADIEAGVGIRGLLPTSQSSDGGSTTYKSGYIGATVYGGPVFRFGQGGASAIAIGAQLDVSAKILSTSEDPFYQRYKGKMSPAVGAYVEYQYKSDSSKSIYYTRLNVARYDAKFSGASAAINDQGKGNTMATVTFGVKY
jgi:hypothetical protein